jgi:POT family proton-dependent oligopeptide transporter
MTSVATIKIPDRQTAGPLRNFCLAFGFQRHTYFVLKAVSFFYFAGVLGDARRALNFHNGFFAALSLAPVCTGAFVRSLAAQRRAVYLGAWLLFFAFAALALNSNRYAAGVLLIAGIGCFNISFKTVFAASMSRFTDKLDVPFTDLYSAINAGSFLAPLVVAYGFSFNPAPPAVLAPPTTIFAWCAACSLLSLYFWHRAVSGRDLLPVPPKLRGAPQSHVFGVVVVTLFSVLFWLGFEQKSGRLNANAADPKIMQQYVWGHHLPSIALQAVNPFMVAVLAAAFAWIWKTLGPRDPHPVAKMSAGMLCLGIGFLLLANRLAAAGGAAISPWWFVLLYAWHSIGELFFEPIGQSLVIANVPERAKAFFLAVWESTTFLAFVGGAWASNYFGDRLYFVLGASVFGSGILLFLLVPVLRRMCKG